MALNSVNFSIYLLRKHLLKTAFSCIARTSYKPLPLTFIFYLVTSFDRNSISKHLWWPYLRRRIIYRIFWQDPPLLSYWHYWLFFSIAWVGVWLTFTYQSPPLSSWFAISIEQVSVCGWLWPPPSSHFWSFSSQTYRWIPNTR